jgi:hypothetical protein
MVAVSAHGYSIVQDLKNLQAINHTVIAEAKQSKYGIARYPYINISWCNKPYVIPNITYDDWNRKCISIGYFNRGAFRLLKDADYKFFEHPERYANALYNGDEFIWINKGRTDGNAIKIDYRPTSEDNALSLAQRVKIAIFPENYHSSDSEVIAFPDSLEIPNDKGLVMIKKPQYRQIKSISIVKQ